MVLRQDELCGRLETTIAQWTAEVTEAHGALGRQIAAARGQLEQLATLMPGGNTQPSEGVTIMRSRLHALEAQAGQNAVRIDELSRRNSALEQELVRLRETEQALRAHADDARKGNTEAEARHAAAQAEIERLVIALQERQAAVAAAEENARTLHAELQGARGALERAEAAHRGLQDETDRQFNEYRELTGDEIARLNEALNRAAADRDESIGVIAGLQERIAELECKLEGLDAELARSRTHAAEIGDRLRQAEQGRLLLESEHAVRREELDAAARDAETLHQALAEARERIDQLASERVVETGARERVEEQRRALQEELGRTIHARELLARQLGDLEMQLEERGRELDGAQHEAQTWRDAHVALGKDHESLAAELSRARDEVNRLLPIEQAHAAATRALAEAAERIEALEASLGERAGELERARERNAGLEADVVRLSTHGEELALRALGLEEQLGQRESGIAELIEQLRERDAAASELGETLRGREATIARIEGEAAQARVKIAMLDDNLNTVNAALREAESRASALNGQLLQLQAQFDQDRARAAEALHAAETTLELLRAEAERQAQAALETLNAAREETTQARHDAEKQAHAAEEALTAVREETAQARRDADEQARAAEEALTAARGETAQARRDADAQARAAREEAAQLRRDADEQARTAQAAFDQLRRQAEEQARAAESQLRAAHNDAQQLRRQSEDQARAAAAAREHLTQIEATLAIFKTQTEREQARLAAEAERGRQELAQTHVALVARQDENRELTARLHERETEAAAMQRSLERIETRLRETIDQHARDAEAAARALDASLGEQRAAAAALEAARAERDTLTRRVQEIEERAQAEQRRAEGLDNEVAQVRRSLDAARQRETASTAENKAISMELAALTDKERQTARDCARALAEVDQLKQRLQKAAEAAEAERLRTARLLSDTMDRLQRELHTATHDDVGKGLNRPHGNGNGNGHGEKQAGYANSRTGNGH